MSELRAIVERMHAVYNARDFDALADLYGPEVDVLVDGTHLQGRAAVLAYCVDVIAEFPGLRMELERVVAETADTIVTETRLLNPSSGASGDAAWNGWRLQGRMCEVHRIVDGRFVSVHTYVAVSAGDASIAGVSSPGGNSARLAAEQSALRRVATLVAAGASQPEVFDAVVTETFLLLGGDFTILQRYDADGAATTLALHGAHGRHAVGDQVSAEGDSIPQRVLRSGQPARVDSYARMDGAGPRTARENGLTGGAGAPVIVQGRIWGVLVVLSRAPRLPVGIEDRLAQFAALLAMAIANTEARTELEFLVEEQVAMRRVAVLVAQGVPAREVFDAVTIEASRLLDDAPTVLMRFDADRGTVVAVCGGGVPIGLRVELAGVNAAIAVRRTGLAARIDDYSGVSGGEQARALGVVASVSAPIVVDGETWGMVTSNSDTGPLPAFSEARLTQFAELVSAAIANAESHAEVLASRARIVAAADDARRRIRRDVHDGAQQRLVHTVVKLKMAQAALGGAAGPATLLVDESLQHAERANAELRELVQGIMPAALTRGGLRAGVTSLLTRIDVPVRAEVLAERLPRAIETTAYFVVAEALTNVMKHSRAASASVSAHTREGRLCVEITDDGQGGADLSRGSGLVGLTDRVAAVGGALTVQSPQGGGTNVSATLPLLAPVAEQ